MICDNYSVSACVKLRGRKLLGKWRSIFGPGVPAFGTPCSEIGRWSGRDYFKAEFVTATSVLSVLATV